MQKAETKAKPVTGKPFLQSAFCLQHSAFLLIALLALAVRLPQLGERPMHTDEAVNAYLAGELLAGEHYQYDPHDRHGPALLELTLPLVRLEGAKTFADLTESQLRLVPVLVGSTTVLLLGAAVEIFGFIPCLVAALLFAGATLPVYYHRYFIHETLFVAACLGLILAGGRALRKNSPLTAAFAGTSAALMLACKETAGLHFIAMGLAIAIVWRQRKPCSIPPVKIWLAGGLGLLITAVLLFTWAGQNWPALGDLFRALPHLAARAGGEGHEKPVWYYLVLLAGGWSGAAILILAALGFSQAFRRPAAGPKLFIAVYAQLILAIYSAIPYKTPWLALNFWLPISLLAGFAIERIWLANPNPTVRAGILTGCAALGLLIIHDTRHWVFLQPADQKNPYAYAHTSGDLLRLPARLEDLARENHLAHPRIAVVAADPWPLPWYLRKFSSAGYWQPDQAPGDADFVITTTDVSGLLAARLKDFHPEFFGLRPNALLILWSPSKIDSRHE